MPRWMFGNLAEGKETFGRWVSSSFRQLASKVKKLWTSQEQPYLRKVSLPSEGFSRNKTTDIIKDQQTLDKDQYNRPKQTETKK